MCVAGQPASARVALAGSGITLALRELHRPRETPWRGPWACGVPQARPETYARLIPAASSRGTTQGGRRRVRISACPRRSSDAAASVRRSTGLSPTRSPAGAGSPCCGARRGWARQRCWATCPTGSPAGTSPEPPASNRRWSWPTRPAPALRAHAGPPRPTARPAAGRARYGVRPQRRPGARPVPGRAGHAHAVRRGRRAAAASLRRRRRAVARPRLGADPGVLCPPPVRRADRGRVCRADGGRR